MLIGLFTLFTTKSSN